MAMAAAKSNVFERVPIQKAADAVLQEIKRLIHSGKLKVGDLLPPERELAASLGVGRGHVREALRQLVFYGILETRPQSGTVVANRGITGLEGLLAGVLKLDSGDYPSLMETRILLEAHAARMAAQRVAESRQDPTILQGVDAAHIAYRERVELGHDALEQDLGFHIAIADAGGNPVIASLLRLIMPDMLRISHKLETCLDGRAKSALKEHGKIVDAIHRGDPEMAATGMQRHLQAGAKLIAERNTRPPSRKRATRK